MGLSTAASAFGPFTRSPCRRARDQRKVTANPSVKLESLPSLNQAWKYQVSPACTAVPPQMGSPVSGEFSEWTAAISFDDAAPIGPAGTVEVVVAIPSLTLGTVTSQAMGADYFDSATFPTATFTAEIERLENSYAATGTLTIRDQSVPVTLPFTLGLEGDIATMKGNLSLDRLDFGIGQGLADESSLAFAVSVNVDLVAHRNE